MEKRGNINPAEREFMQLTGADKFRIVLKMFGTEQARQNFIKKCQEYYAIRTKTQARANVENYRKGPKVDYSPPKRAEVHNAIMDTIKRLANAKKWGPLQEKVLNEMSDREVVAQIIHDYLSHEKWLAESDDEYKNSGGPKEGQSDTAYFHSLGRGE